MENQNLKIEKVGDSRLGWIFGYSHIGPSHKQGEKPNQDAYNLCSGSFAGTPYLIACVADGHGDKKYTNSHIGSSYAVQDASYVFGQMLLLEEVSANSFKSEFPRKIIKKWDRSVSTHGEKTTSFAGAEKPTESKSSYGTTLISALVYKQNLYLGQIGDGLAFYLDDNDNLEKPIPEASETLVGGTTDSLCSENPINLFRTAIRDISKGGHLFIFTDGLQNAFKDDSQNDIWAKDLTKLLKEYGEEKIAKALPEWLDKYSKCSGDDTTVVIMKIDPEPKM